MNENKLARFGGSPVLTKEDIISGLGQWPDIIDTDISAVLSVLQSSREPWGFLHPVVQEFQEKYQSFVDRKFCIAVSSGTAALHLAIAACNIEAGSEVITPALGYIASATCILHQNCIPVFAEIDSKTFNIDPSRLEEKITPRTKAIIAVDLLGLPAQFDEISKIASKYGIPVIEDASQSQGATYKGKRTGSLGDVSALSIMASKNLPSCGEGGLITTDSKCIAQGILKHASLGMNLWEGKNIQPKSIAHQLGFNYRPTPICSAFAAEQLKRLPFYQERRVERAELFRSIVNEIPFIRVPYVPQGSTHAYQMYRLTVLPEVLGLEMKSVEHLRDIFVFLLRAEGAICGFWEDQIIPEMPIFQSQIGYGSGCPWTCHGASLVTYGGEDFKVSHDVLKSSFMPFICRATHSLNFVRKQAEAYLKVAQHTKIILELVEQLEDVGGFKAWSGVSIRDEYHQSKLILCR